MKRLLLLLAVTAVVAPNTGCCLIDKLLCHAHKCCGTGCGAAGCGSCGPSCGPACGDCAPACNSCGGHGCGLCGGRGGGAYGDGAFVPGPLTAQTTYPYYTTRGPRDFLAKNPPSIGP